MRVALDLSHTRLSSAGTARYALDLCDALSARADVALIPLGSGGAVSRQHRRERYATVASHDLLWYPLRGRRAARAAGAAVYHVPIARGPLTRGAPPTVVTIHDMVPFRYPETMGSWNRHYSRAMLGQITRSADIVTCVSQDTADDVARLLSIPAERIRVVHNGVSPIWFEQPVDSAPQVQHRYAQHPYAQHPYVLFVGTPEPRKNLQRLLRAMSLLAARGRSERLVIAGSEGWGPLIPGDGTVTMAGRVSDVELRSLYAHAACVVLPSLHEGFGLTAVEAMAAGAPTVVSNSGALPEICGPAAVYVDPLDVTSIADGIEAALAGLAPSRDIRIDRARRFSWSAAADALVEVYREIA